jgi:hypothetical protein
MRRFVVAASALLILSLAAASVGAQEPSLKIVVGKTTKDEILDFFGPPHEVHDKGNLVYDSSRLTPAQKVPLRRALPETFVIFAFDGNGILRRWAVTGPPPP